MIHPDPLSMLLVITAAMLPGVAGSISGWLSRGRLLRNP